MKKSQTITSLIFQQNVLTILLLTFVVVAIWVGFSIYFSYSKTTIGTTDAALIAPLSPKLDTALFDALAARKNWSDADLVNFTPSVVVTPTNTTATVKAGTLTPITLTGPVSTSSASISATKP